MRRLVLSALFVLTACGSPDAIIHYHQVGACNGGVGQSGDPSTSYFSGTNQAYVIFAVESVDNSQVTSSWTLDPTKFHVGSDNFDPNLMIYHWVLGPFALVDTTIPAGAAVYPFSPYAYGALVVQTADANGADEANMTNYSLLYTPTGPGVVMEKSPPTSWPDRQNCAAVTLQ